MEAATIKQFDVEVTNRSPGYNLPQKVGDVLWLPMLAMALMAFPIAVILGIVRADEISTGGSAETIETLRHVQVGAMFIGFASVFAAISFAIARILGQFRKGGGDLQEASGRRVVTLKMPVTAKVFLATMMMAMMTLLGAAVLHFVFAADVSGTTASLELSAERFTVLEGVRRVGIAMYLVAITLGLATIAQVLRFQSSRVRQLPAEEPRA
ncbi:MAG: hypothetical protein H0V08_02870 [Thermoleophilaceae bacterium]|jgi:hypothetical protein|nr:hypothetical protein [Thermoleophilaceae bacterium]